MVRLYMFLHDIGNYAFICMTLQKKNEYFNFKHLIVSDLKSILLYFFLFCQNVLPLVNKMFYLF